MDKLDSIPMIRFFEFSRQNSLLNWVNSVFFEGVWDFIVAGGKKTNWYLHNES